MELCLCFNAAGVQALRGLGVCCDEIVFGKPAVDARIGGGVDNVHEDMEKEVSSLRVATLFLQQVAPLGDCLREVLMCCW